ncbi:MAG: hypothetical protein U1E45_13055 [Geminicoccaceae bacterium]
MSPGTLFVIYGDEPVSWVMPLLPKAAGFVRIAGNIDIDPQFDLGRQVMTRLAGHQGPMRTLAAHRITDEDRQRLELYGLYADPSDCVEVPSHSDTMVSCSARLDVGIQDQRAPVEDDSTS